MNALTTLVMEGMEVPQFVHLRHWATVKPTYVWNQRDKSKCDCEPRHTCPEASVGRMELNQSSGDPLLNSVSIASQCTPLSLS